MSSCSVCKSLSGERRRHYVSESEWCIIQDQTRLTPALIVRAHGEKLTGRLRTEALLKLKKVVQRVLGPRYTIQEYCMSDHWSLVSLRLASCE